MGRYRKGITQEEYSYRKYLTEYNKLAKRYGMSAKYTEKQFKLAVRENTVIGEVFNVKEFLQGQRITTTGKARELAELLIEKESEGYPIPPIITVEYNKDGSINKPSITRQIASLNSVQFSDLVSEMIEEDIFESSDDFEDWYY